MGDSLLSKGLSALGNLGEKGASAITGGLVGAGFDVLNSASDRAYSQQMWDKQMEYNKPINQRKRWEDAGFNPYMMMGSGAINTGSAGTAPQLVGLHEATNSNKIVDASATMMNTMVQADLIRAQTDKAKADTAFTEANTTKTLDYDMPNIAANTASTLTDTEYKKSLIVAQNMDNQFNSELKEPRMKAEIDNLVSQTLNNEEQRKLIKTNTKLAAQNILESAARTANIKMDTKQIAILTPLLANKLVADANLANANTNLSNANTANTNVNTALNKNELDFQNEKDHYGRTNYSKQRGYELRNLKLDSGMKQFDAAQQESKSTISTALDILNGVTGLGGLGVGVGNMYNGKERNALFKQHLDQPTVIEHYKSSKSGYNKYSHTVTHH